MSSGGGPEPERCARRSHRPMRRIACGREASTVISVDSTTNQVLLQVLFLRCTDNRCQIMFQKEIIVVGRSDQAKIELTSRQEARERRIVTTVKPFAGTLRVTNPARKSRASSRKRVLHDGGQPPL